MVLIQDLLISFGISNLHIIHSFNGIVLEEVQKIVYNINFIFPVIVHYLGQNIISRFRGLFLRLILFFWTWCVGVEASVNFWLYMGVDLVVFIGFVPNVIIIARTFVLSNFPNRLPVFVKQLTFFAVELLCSPPFTTIKWVQKILSIKK